MRVSLIAAVSSTHGNVMGGRTTFFAFPCNGDVCTVTALANAQVSPPGWHQLFILDSPTPSHGVFVRIGGDPAELGNWPALPGFDPTYCTRLKIFWESLRRSPRTISLIGLFITYSSDIVSFCLQYNDLLLNIVPVVHL
jgi:hypothetical protein